MSKRNKKKHSVAADRPEAEATRAVDQAAPAADSRTEEALLDARLEEALRQALGGADPAPDEPEREGKPEQRTEREQPPRSAYTQPRRKEPEEAKPAQEAMDDTFGLEKALEALMNGTAPSQSEETETPQPGKAETAEKPRLKEEKEEPVPAAETPQTMEKAAEQEKLEKTETEKKHKASRRSAEAPEQEPPKMEAAAPIMPEKKAAEKPHTPEAVPDNAPEDDLLQSVSRLLGDRQEGAPDEETLSTDELLKDLERLLQPAQRAVPEGEKLPTDDGSASDIAPEMLLPEAEIQKNPEIDKRLISKADAPQRKPQEAPVEKQIPKAEEAPAWKEAPEMVKQPEPEKQPEAASPASMDNTGELLKSLESLLGTSPETDAPQRKRQEAPVEKQIPKVEEAPAWKKAPETVKQPEPESKPEQAELAPMDNTGELLKSLESLLGTSPETDTPQRKPQEAPVEKQIPKAEEAPAWKEAPEMVKQPEPEKQPEAVSPASVDSTGDLLKSLESLLGTSPETDAPQPERQEAPVEKQIPKAEEAPAWKEAPEMVKQPEPEKQPEAASPASVDSTGDLLKSLESLLGTSPETDTPKPMQAEQKRAAAIPQEAEPAEDIDDFLKSVDAFLGRISAQPGQTTAAPSPLREEKPEAPVAAPLPQKPANPASSDGEVAPRPSAGKEAPTDTPEQKEDFWSFLDDLKQEIRPAPSRPEQVGDSAGKDRPEAPTPRPEASVRNQSPAAQQPPVRNRREATPPPTQTSDQAASSPRKEHQPGALTVEELLAAAVPAELAAGARAAVSVQEAAAKPDGSAQGQRRRSRMAPSHERPAPAPERPDREERGRRAADASAGQTQPRRSPQHRAQAVRQSPAPEETAEFTGIRSGFDKVPPLQEQAVLHPEEAYKKYGKQLGATGAKLIVLCFLALAGVFLTLYAGLGWHFLPAALTARVLAYTLLVLMLLSAVLCLDLFADALRTLRRMRLGLNGLLLLTVAAVAVDAFFAAAEGRVPFCAAVQFLLIFAMWGKYARCMSMMTATRTLRGMDEPVGIVEVQDVTRGRRGLSRANGSVEQFMGEFSTDNPGDTVMGIYAPLAAAVCFVGALTISLMRHGSFPWMLSLMLIGSVPLVGLLGYSRLFHGLSKRLAASGAVVCGWYGAEVFGGEHSIILEDDDLFPPGSVKLNGMKVYNGDIDRTISYAAAATELCGNAMHRMFHDLLESRNGRRYRVSRHRFYEGGGLGAEVAGDILLLGSYAFMKRMGVHMEGCAKLRQAVYASVNGELAAVFAVKYQPSEAVRKGLAAISRNRHFKPILATRDFLVTPEFLKEKYQISVSNFAYPSTKERIRLSEAEFKKGAEQGALLSGNSFGAFAEAAAGGRVLKSATLCSTALSVISGVLSLGLMLALAFFGSAEAANAVNVLLYLAGWSIPALLLTGWTRHY